MGNNDFTELSLLLKCELYAWSCIIIIIIINSLRWTGLGCPITNTKPTFIIGLQKQNSANLNEPIPSENQDKGATNIYPNGK